MRNSTRLRRVVALATLAGTLAAPAAWAAPFEERVPSSADNGSAGNGSQGEAYSSVTALAPPSSSPNGARGESYSTVTALAPPSSPPSVAQAPSTPVSGDGFGWGDAGIGAAAMLALAAIVGGAALVVMHRPGRGRTIA